MPVKQPLPPPSANPHLFFVDGYALIYRAFFAMIARPLTTARGENTSAAWGVTQFILRLYERYDPRHLGWVLDMGRSFRQETYAAYKATREKLAAEQQQDFDQSMTRIRELLDAFRIPVLGVNGYEADDVIGTLVTHAMNQGVAAAIISGDKDFYQLVAPGDRASVDDDAIDSMRSIRGNGHVRQRRGADEPVVRSGRQIAEQRPWSAGEDRREPQPLWLVRRRRERVDASVDAMDAAGPNAAAKARRRDPCCRGLLDRE